MSDTSATATVTIYTREDCHLCAAAIATVRRVESSVPTEVRVDEVDVDTDPELAAEYGERVPYVLVDGHPRFKFRVEEAELRRHLTAEAA